MRSRRKLVQVNEAEVRLLDEDEQETLIESYKQSAQNDHVFWTRSFKVITALLMCSTTYTVIVSHTFCRLVNALSSQPIVSETNCLYAYITTFTCFCCCLVGLSWSSKIDGETNYIFMVGSLLPGLLFGTSCFTKRVFVYYHLFPILYMAICGCVLRTLDSTKNKIKTLEGLKYKYKKV